MQPLTSGGGGSGSNTNVLASPLHTFESSNRQTLPNESSDKYQENQTGAISGSNDDSVKPNLTSKRITTPQLRTRRLVELQKETDNNDGSNEDNNKLYSNQYHSRSSSFLNLSYH